MQRLLIYDGRHVFLVFRPVSPNFSPSPSKLLAGYGKIASHGVTT
jgi:hypothetical protein